MMFPCVVSELCACVAMRVVGESVDAVVRARWCAVRACAWHVNVPPFSKSSVAICVCGGPALAQNSAEVEKAGGQQSFRDR